VQIPDTSCKFIINFETSYCDCRNFREYALPCAHVITACRHDTEDPYQFVDWTYSVEAYQKTYSYFIWPVNIKNLPSDNEVLPLVFQKQRGRPLTKRIRKGA